MKSVIVINVFVLLFLQSFAQTIATKSYWQQIKTEPYQGKQDDIYFLNENLGWYCNGSGKIYKTTNGGTDWKLVFEKKGTFFRCVGFIDSLTGFAGNIGIDYFPNVEDTVPLYKTIDGGKTWAAVLYKGPTVKGLCAIDICKESFINAGVLGYKTHVFCGGRVGSPAFTMISHDDGKSFTSQDMSNYCKYILDIKFFNVKEGVICAASSDNLETSHALIIGTSDGGKTWQKRYESKRPFELTWKCFFPSRNVGYTTIQSYDTSIQVSQRYLAKTIDGGKTWKEIPLVKDFAVREFGVAFTDEKHGWVGAVPYGFETMDGGLTWQPSYMGPATNKIRIMNKLNGEKTAIAIGVIVSKNKSVINSGYDAIAAMRNAYAGGRWYKTISFSQHTHFIKDGKENRLETWHEAAMFPGKLLVKFNSKDSKTGVLIENNKSHYFKENESVNTQNTIHHLLLTAFDVYFLKPFETTHLLDSLGYNLKLVREDVFNNKKVLVIGAAKGDELSNQIWIDAESFYLHRLIYKNKNDLNDVTFEDYEKIENNWVAKTITFKLNGQLNLIENYYDIKFPKELNTDLFNPEKFKDVILD